MRKVQSFQSPKPYGFPMLVCVLFVLLSLFACFSLVFRLVQLTLDCFYFIFFCMTCFSLVVLTVISACKKKLLPNSGIFESTLKGV